MAMVRRRDEVVATLKPSPFNGMGEITVRELLNGPVELYEKGRVFAHTTVYPGSGIGFHVHNNESETYFIMSGTGTFNDNGTEVEFGPGDVLFTGDGEGHSIEASHGVPIEMVALILYHNIERKEENT